MTDDHGNPEVSASSHSGTEQIERVLAEFWSELLEIDHVNPENRILELGGNSLVATMLANRIELTWGFRPLVEDIFAKSLRELAQLCEHAAQQQRSLENV